MKKLTLVFALASIMILGSSCKKKGHCYYPSSGTYGPTASGSDYAAAQSDCQANGGEWENE